MKDVIYFWMDAAELAIFGGLLIYLVKGILPERFILKKKIHASFFMWLQFVALRQFLAYSQWAKKLIYGADMYIADSKQSILPFAVSFFVTLIAGMFFYKGSRMKLLSLVTAYYTLWELTRFLLYPAAVWSITALAKGYMQREFEKGNQDIALFEQGIAQLEMVWNFLHIVIIIAGFGFFIWKYKRYLLSGQNTYQAEEAAILFVPELLGLLFAVMLRSILFYYKKQVYSLIEQYPELNIMIPCVSLLCIASILLSVKMLGKLEEEQEKRQRAELHQRQAEELYSHVKDIENVNVKIRGMKHDMKHYIADINALLAKIESGDVQAKEEVRRYADSLHMSLESLDTKCKTNHPVTDVILGRYERLTEQKNIAFANDFVYPNHMGIDVFDISVILNNGLENALEACEKEAECAEMKIVSKQRGNMFLITIENSFTHTLQWEDGFPVSEKKGSGHGLGMKNIRDRAEQYYGRADIQVKEGRFYLTVMLQGSTKHSL